MQECYWSATSDVTALSTFILPNCSIFYVKSTWWFPVGFPFFLPCYYSHPPPPHTHTPCQRTFWLACVIFLPGTCKNNSGTCRQHVPPQVTIMIIYESSSHPAGQSSLCRYGRLFMWQRRRITFNRLRNKQQYKQQLASTRCWLMGSCDGV